MSVFERMASACGVCGSEDLEMDQVHRGGRWLLATCRRCDHRWTAQEHRPVSESRRASTAWASQEDLVAA